MPDDDHGEPLDRWLEQRIQPLPPPPGTFELISHRARRRKLSRAITTSAAGVFVTAGALLATTNPSLLRLGTPVESGQAAAGTRPPVPLASPVRTLHQPNGSDRLPTSARPASSAPEAARSPVPGPAPEASGSATASAAARSAPGCGQGTAEAPESGLSAPPASTVPGGTGSGGTGSGGTGSGGTAPTAAPPGAGPSGCAQTSPAAPEPSQPPETGQAPEPGPTQAPPASP